MRGMDESLDGRGQGRRTLIISGAAALAVWAGRAPLLAMRDVSGPDPFKLGVASGDPWADSVVLWTRLAPEPFAEDGFGGMPAREVDVRWELAADDRFTKVVRRGRVTARPSSAHAVHVEAARQQRHEHATVPAQRFEHRTAIDRKARRVPVDLDVRIPAVEHRMEFGGERAECLQGG